MRHPTRERILRWHRRLSLLLLPVWVLQIGSGLLLALHRELPDALLGASAKAIDVAGVAATLDRLETELAPARVEVVAPGGLLAGHLRVLLANGPADGVQVVIDGGGRELRRIEADAFERDAGLWLYRLHRHLHLGAPGEWLLRFSGIVLLLNIALGLRLLLGGRLRDALLPALLRRQAKARLRMAHRSLAAWIGLPLLCVVAAGVGMAIDTRGGANGLPTPHTGQALPSAGAAWTLAAGLLPSDATPGLLHLPVQPGAPATLRWRASGELPQREGRSFLRFDPSTGAVIEALDAGAAAPLDRLRHALPALHAGEALGAAGVVLVMASALGALALGALGASIALSRRPKTSADAAPLTSIRSEESRP